MTTRYPLPLLLLLLLIAACTPPPAASPTASPTGVPTVAPTASAPPTSADPTATADSPPAGGASTLLPNGAGENDQWKGIGRLYGVSTCTASFIATSADEAAPAYALTNGHCIEWLANGVLTLPEFEGEVIFNFFSDTEAGQIAVPIRGVPYSTMQGVDVAIVELEATVGELTAQGVQPLTIAAVPLAEENDVFVIGAPSSQVAPEEAFLRREDCRLTGRTDLLEFQWHFDRSYRNSCQDIFGGSSGSPLFAAGGNEIAALINTTVEGESICYLGVPCEIGPDGVTLDPASSYATPVDGLAACFDAAGRFALSADCRLPPPEQQSAEGQPLGASQPPLRWGTTLTGTLPYYRYKTGRAGEVECRSDEGYSPPIALAESDQIDEAIPDEEGFYLLCIQAGPSATVDESWQPLDFPTVLIAQIDTTPPTLDPQILVRPWDEGVQVDFIFEPPELSDYRFKVGPPDSTDCDDDADYETFRRIAPTVENDELPALLCVIGADSAGNETPPLEQLLTKE